MLDIILGNSKHYFSTGELLFFPTNGIQDNEYCSCGAKVHDCEFWSQIILKWNAVRNLTLENYITIQQQTQRNKRTISAVKNFYFPSKEYKVFVSDTRKLYDLIFDETKAEVIIDSSKIPQRLLLLRKLGFSLKVVHLNRSLTGVLYSTSKELTMDPAAGIEKTIAPQSRKYVISSWLLCNVLVRLFSLGLPVKSIRYEQLLSEPVKLLSSFVGGDQTFSEKLHSNGPFIPNHLVAGGRIRMKKSLTIDPSLKLNETVQIEGLTGWFIGVLDRIKW